jgi:hypothetical protein
MQILIVIKKELYCLKGWDNIQIQGFKNIIKKSSTWKIFPWNFCQPVAFDQYEWFLCKNTNWPVFLLKSQFIYGSHTKFIMLKRFYWTFFLFWLET